MQEACLLFTGLDNPALKYKLLYQWCPILHLEDRCPAEFTSNTPARKFVQMCLIGV